MSRFYLRIALFVGALACMVSGVAVVLGSAFPGGVVAFVSPGQYRGVSEPDRIEFHDLRSEVVFQYAIPEEYDGFGVIMPTMLLNESHRLPVLLQPQTPEPGSIMIDQAVLNFQTGQLKFGREYDPLVIGRSPDERYELQRDADFSVDEVYRVDTETGERVTIEGLSSNRYYLIDEDGTFLLLDAGTLLRYQIDTLTESAPEVIVDGLPQEALVVPFAAHAIVYTEERVLRVDLATGSIMAELTFDAPVVHARRLSDEWAGVLVRLQGNPPRGGDLMPQYGATDLQYGLYTIHLPTGALHEIDINTLFDTEVSVFIWEQLRVSPDGEFVMVSGMNVGSNPFNDRFMVVARLDGREVNLITQANASMLNGWLSGEDATFYFVERTESVRAIDRRLVFYEAATSTRRVMLEGGIQGFQIDEAARRIYAKMQGEIMEFIPNSRAASLHVVEINLDTGAQRTVFITSMANQQLAYYPGE